MLIQSSEIVWKHVLLFYFRGMKLLTYEVINLSWTPEYFHHHLIKRNIHKKPTKDILITTDNNIVLWRALVTKCTHLFTIHNSIKLLQESQITVSSSQSIFSSKHPAEHISFPSSEVWNEAITESHPWQTGSRYFI